MTKQELDKFICAEIFEVQSDINSALVDHVKFDDNQHDLEIYNDKVQKILIKFYLDIARKLNS